MQDRTPAWIDPETGEICWSGAEGDGAERGAARPPGPQAEGPYRLDKRTYLSWDEAQKDKEKRYRGSLTDYGGGLCEVGWSLVADSRKQRKISARGESANRKENKERAVRRARSTIRKKILACGLDHLLTLTYRENVTNFQQASADLTRFTRLLRTELPDFYYVAVPEKQERGAWHWHLAVKGRQDVMLLRKAWRRIVGDGNIDVQRPKGKQGQRLALVKYLGKYLAKSFELDLRELNGHRFRASLGMKIPTSAVSIPQEARGSVHVYMLAKLLEHAGKTGFDWQHDDGLAGWACSW